jgi:hypothetical protein
METEFYRPKLSLSQQLLGFQGLAGFRARLRDRKHLIAEGDITPTEISETYRVRIEYTPGEWPETFVVSPELVTRKKGVKIPHMYGQKELCLFLPLAREWRSDMPIATTIVPWASEWLHYYELWHLTGEWRGGGHEPDDKQPYRREPN